MAVKAEYNPSLKLNLHRVERTVSAGYQLDMASNGPMIILADLAAELKAEDQ